MAKYYGPAKGISQGLAIASLLVGPKVMTKLGQMGGRTYSKVHIKNLKNINTFASGTSQHIFDGTINKRGKATGYHYNMVKGSAGSIIPGTRSKLGSGVYKAKVQVNGIPKTGNGGYSTFFPNSMSPQEVVDAINQAYYNRTFIAGNEYKGYTSSGMEIRMYLDKNGKIISAFPK